MDINRNQVFLAGIVLLFLGTEFRMMDSFVLNAKVTRLLAEQTNHPVATAGNTMGALVGLETAAPHKTLPVPEWLGWFCLSFGSVLVLQSLTMGKPG
jgi:hypothetical protein